MITGLTAGWYREVLGRLPHGACVLDIGIGTGGAVARCAELIRARDIHIVGIDIDHDYLQRCAQEVARAGLAEHVRPCLASVYHHRGGPYDAAYFSASLMLLPDPVTAMRHVAAQLAPGGALYFTQTFHARRSVLREKLKPAMRRVTTIDFGRVTYEDDFRDAIEASGLRLDDFVTLRRTRSASFVLAVARPVGGAGNGEDRDALIA
ncbi:MAG TPA: class I SAM-dependent methyltransferase [Pseudonocardia sp.]|nr:class I SAM-dependent methyltransferase [Pseudonocardia sp.]